MIKIRLNLLLAFILLLSPAFITIASAQNDAAPSEESFIQSWEEFIKNQDTTISLEKTDQDSVYNFKSKLFDYDGQLKLLNVLIKETQDYRHSSNKDTSTLYEGSAEVELLSNEQDLKEKFPKSYDEWKSLQRLYFLKDQNQWIDPESYYQLLIEKNETSFRPENYGIYVTYGFLLLLVLFMIRNIIVQKKRTNKQDEILKLHLENQRKQIELLETISKKVS